MKTIIGIVGKPSSGKSTFLNAACLTHAKTSEIPFTTIDPNKGIAYISTKCVCRSLDVQDNPQNSRCIDGIRYIPINLLDVAGLVPDAHNGKGLGNQFLNDLSQADLLLQVVDATGILDKMGKLNQSVQNDPLEDVSFLENEIAMWFKEILERKDWSKFTRQANVGGESNDKFLYQRLSGLKISKLHIISALKTLHLENKSLMDWTEEDRFKFAKEVRKLAKPFVFVANKIDKEESKPHLVNLQTKYGDNVIPCSALAEHFLRDYEQKEVIEYLPGENNFQIKLRDKLSDKELEMLNKIEEKILKIYGGTGVQQALNHAIFKVLDFIVVYPVSDINTLADNKNNILPDAFLVKRGTTLKNFVRDYIHTELADKFMFGMDAVNKKKLGEKYELQHNNVIRIITSK